ncbi:MAG: CBS domain-containing protein [Bdellovibrionales bacterium]
MKAIPKIQKYMTTTPYAINWASTLEEAMKVMAKHEVRHLPVIKDGNMFGVVSDRDIRSILSFAGSNPTQLKVGDVCTDKPYVTKPDALLNEVATQMAREKFGSALVVDNGKLVGIFTVTDACLALSEICEQKFSSH